MLYTYCMVWGRFTLEVEDDHSHEDCGKHVQQANLRYSDMVENSKTLEMKQIMIRNQLRITSNTAPTKLWWSKL